MLKVKTPVIIGKGWEDVGSIFKGTQDGGRGGPWIKKKWSRGLTEGGGHRILMALGRRDTGAKKARADLGADEKPG